MGVMFNLLTEVAERIKRVETRLVVLGDKVGVDLRTETRVEVKLGGPKADPFVEINALDVSISRIMSAVKEADVRPAILVPVMFNGALVAKVVSQ